MHPEDKVNICVYPGTFDPITNGHIDIVNRARRMFPRIRILVAKDTNKETLFSFPERLSIVKSVVSNIDRVECDGFEGLLTGYLERNNIKAVVRGLRAVSDFDYEFQLTLTIRKLHQDIEFVFLMPGEEYFFLSSSLVKQIASLGGDVSSFVPEVVKVRLQEKLSRGKPT